MSLKYFLYVRKSSESEDRQMASIEDQIAEMMRFGKEHGLLVVATIAEAKSAKAPGRPAFNEMLKRIEKGEASGILCWKLNRLARNPVDGGQISWMLQQNIIEHIQTYGRDYKPSDNVLMMQVEFGMANQYVRDLSVDVRRGLRRKAERGWYPCHHLPVGYIHNPAESKEDLTEEILLDTKLFPLVKKLWRLMLTGNYSVAAIKRKGDKLGVRHSDGRAYSHNAYHRLFTNKFYCGYFTWTNDNGEEIEYLGKHKKMVTEKEFNKVQSILRRFKNPTRHRTYVFPYRGLIECGECNGHVTAERQYQLICPHCKLKFSIKTRKDCPRCGTAVSQMEKPSVIDITYYRCTKNHGTCMQGCITSRQIEESLVSELENITIDREYQAWALQAFKELNDASTDELQRKIAISKKRETELSNKIDGLIHMRSGNEITEDQFRGTKEKIETELFQVKQRLEHIQNSTSDWEKRANEYFEVALTASREFQRASDMKKRKIASKIALNLILKDKQLYISTRKVLLRIKEGHLAYLAEKKCFEPEKTIGRYSSLKGFIPSISLMRRKLKPTRTYQSGKKSHLDALRRKLKAIRTCLIDNFTEDESRNQSESKADKDL